MSTFNDMVGVWPLLRADGTEVRGTKAGELFRVVTPDPGTGETRVQGMESRANRWVATTSVIETGLTYEQIS